MFAFFRARRLIAGAMLVLALALVSIAEDRDEQAASASTAADRFPRETLLDCAGGRLSLHDARGRVATVLVCLGVECPISNEYLPTLNRLAAAFKLRGVKVIGINPNGGESLEAMAAHAQEFKLTFPFVKDTDGKVARQLGFQVTPQVCVFDAHGRQVYFGRIDDRYRAREGTVDEKASSELAKALEEVLTGKPVSVARTKAMGCPIQFSAQPAG